MSIAAPASVFGPFGFSVFPASGSGGHLYWRVYMLTSDDGGALGVAEISMASSPGGTDLCTGGTASASSSYSTFLPANAFDDSAATYWQAFVSNTFAPAWIQYQFPRPVTVRELKIKACTTGLPNPNFSPNTFTVLGSNDGVTWIAYQQWTWQTGWTSAEERTFTVPTDALPTSGAPRLWMIDTTQNDGGAGGLGMAELAMASVGGGTDLTIGGEAAAVNWFGGLPPPRLIDQSTANEWASFNSSTLTGFVMVKLLTGADIVEVKITARAAGAASQAPRNFLIKYSYDGVTWTTVKTVTGSTGWTSNETRTFTIP